LRTKKKAPATRSGTAAVLRLPTLSLCRSPSSVASTVAISSAENYSKSEEQEVQKNRGG
jgi:hypothetical protein